MRDRLAAGGLPGPAHAVRQSLGEDAAIFRGAVVVFPGPDVPPRAIEMDMQGFRHRQLPEKSRHSREVGVRKPGAVVALRVRREVAQDGDRVIAAPEAHQGDGRIDGPFRLGPQGGVLARGVAHRAHFPVGSEEL